MIILLIILFLGITVYVLSKKETPVYLDDQNKPITSQDDLENVIEESTNDIVEKNNLKLKEKLLNDDVIEKPVIQLEGVRQLTEHIKEVIKINPDSKKNLNKRQRKTVDKII